jgi:glycosyltransferase involved in cell wall biosynthesis
MKILFLSNVFPNPYQPTKGTFNLELVRALSRRHGARVVSPVSWVDEWQYRGKAAAPLGGERRAVVGGVEVCYPRFYYPPRVLRSLYGKFLWHSIRPAVRRFLDEERPDVVLGYWAHPDGEVALRVASSVGAPGAVMVGGSDVLLLGRQPRRRRCIRGVLERADAVITASRDLKDQVAGFGIDPGRVHVAYRGVDPDRFFPGDRAEARRRLGLAAGDRVLLWVGRMVPVKGLDVLLAACGRLRDRGVAFRLHLVGDGPLRPALQEQARALGLSAAVAFAGSVPHDRLPDWYRAADLTVLPSRSEGVPNVLRESAACGTPFVASRVGGIAEVADPARDRLVPAEDPAALAEAVAASLREGRPSPHAGAAGSSAGWDEAAETVVRILQPLVAARTVRGPAEDALHAPCP